MRSSRLGLVGRFVLALLAVCVLGAMVVSAAQAEPTRALVWKVEGKVLANNETREITIKDFETKAITFEMPVQKIAITCNEVRTGKGAYIANEDEMAITESTLEFNLCSVTGNGTGCQVEQPVKFKPIRTEFVLNDEETTKTPGNKILVEFDPSAGSGKEVVELSYFGSSCKFKNVVGRQLFLGSMWTDPVTNGDVEEGIELGVLPKERSSYLIKFPDEPKSVFLWNKTNTKWELFEPKQLEFFNERTSLTGTALVLLAKNGKSMNENYGLSETGK